MARIQRDRESNFVYAIAWDLVAFGYSRFDSDCGRDGPYGVYSVVVYTYTVLGDWLLHLGVDLLASVDARDFNVCNCFKWSLCDKTALIWKNVFRGFIVFFKRNVIIEVKL